MSFLIGENVCVRIMWDGGGLVLERYTPLPDRVEVGRVGVTGQVACFSIFM